MSAPKTTPATPEINKKNEGGDTRETAYPGSINAPFLNAEGKPQAKAVETEMQAFSICKTLRQRALEGRIKTGAIILEKYGGASPYVQADLKKTGQDWRNNFSTNWLASIIDRVKPQMLDPIQRADAITYSRLPDEVQDSAKKSGKFCEVTTRTIREWTGWNDLLSGIAQEDVLFGSNVVVRLSEDWRPKVTGFNESFLPEGTGQHADKTQVVPTFQRMLVHEFVELIFRDVEASKDEGYDIDNCIAAANRATNIKQDEDAMEKQNAMREQGIVGYSYENANKTVDLYHLIVREYDGYVYLWTIDMHEGKKIRVVKLAEKMEDVVCLFTLQTGNRKFYGSKGLGRMLTNLHIAIERGRNLAADQNYLSGLVILRADQSARDKLSPIVKHPFVIIDKEIEISPEVVEFNAESFELMDKKLNTIGESIAGAFIPPNIDQQGAPNTKIEAAQRAERELAVRQGVLGRFFDQFADLVNMMQRAMYSEECLKEAQRIYDEKLEKKKKGIRLIASKVWNLIKGIASKLERPGQKIEEEPTTKITDEAAVRAAVELLENGLTVEEIALLAVSPSGNNAADEGSAKDQATVQFINENQGSPYIDQQAATEMKGRILIGDDRTSQLMTPMEDPNVQAIAQRQQLVELSEMLDGVAMPVSGTDNHEIHWQVLEQKGTPIFQLLLHAPTPAQVTTASYLIQHLTQHNNFNVQSGPDMQKKRADEIATLTQILKKATTTLAKQQQQMQQQGINGDPSQMPPPAPGQPMLGQPPQQQLSPELQMKNQEMLMDFALRHKDQQLREQELQLKAQDQQHRHATDVVASALDAQNALSNAAATATKQGFEAANSDLNRAGASDADIPVNQSPQ